MSDAIATGNGSSGEMRPWEELARDLENLASLDSDSSFEIAANVIDQIMVAQSAEEVFAANESGPADVADYLNQKIGILDVRFRKSAERFREGTLGFYVIFDFVDGEGEKGLMSTGAPNVVASLRRFQRLNLIDGVTPFELKIKGRETERGQLYTVHGPNS